MNIKSEARAIKNLKWTGIYLVKESRRFYPNHELAGNVVGFSGFDAKGKQFEVEATGFHARVVQHECDHLDGILYPQRIQDLRQFAFTDELL